MSDVAHTEIEAPARKPRKRRTTKRRRAAAPKGPVKAPAEFAGMTEFDCCTGCQADKARIDGAQQRLNELQMAYPKQDSRWDKDDFRRRGLPLSQTVLESDAEWLERNPHIAEEFRQLSAAMQSHCVISGGARCAHPFKGGLQDKRNTEAVARYERAKKVLAHRKIDLRAG